jgi:uncharacterized protein YraI
MSRRRFQPIGYALAIAVLLAPAMAQAAPAFVTTRLSLRAGPSTEYPAIALLEPGVQVDVLGCLEGYEWCDITIGQDRGWVAGAYLQSAYYQEREPLPQIGATIGLPIIGFSFGNYWDSHYRNRSWYRERERWEHRAFNRPPPPGWRPDRPGWRPDRSGFGPGHDGRGPDRSRFGQPDDGRPGPHRTDTWRPDGPRFNGPAQGSDRGGPDRGGPDRGGPDRGGPDRGGPDRGGPDRDGSDRGGAGWGGPPGGERGGGGPNRDHGGPGPR